MLHAQPLDDQFVPATTCKRFIEVTEQPPIFPSGKEVATLFSL